MKVNLTNMTAINLSANDATVGEVYLLTHLTNPAYAIRLDEPDENGFIQFADFDGIICHVRPEERVRRVSSAEVNIED